MQRSFVWILLATAVSAQGQQSPPHTGASTKPAASAEERAKEVTITRGELDDLRAEVEWLKEQNSRLVEKLAIATTPSIPQISTGSHAGGSPQTPPPPKQSDYLKQATTNPSDSFTARAKKLRAANRACRMGFIRRPAIPRRRLTRY